MSEYNNLIILECVECISEAISNNYCLDTYCLNSKSALNAVLDKFDTDIVKYILSAHISNSINDGRYSDDNKTWALENEYRNAYVIIKAHAGLVDMFTTTFREYEKGKGD